MARNWYKGYAYGIGNIGESFVYYIYDQFDSEKIVERGTATTLKNGSGVKC
jgi:hypothetical protein